MINSIILNSEQEFRYYIINNLSIIKKIYVFSDALDNLIYFYLFTKNNIAIATKDDIKYSKYYNEIYKNLCKKYNLDILINLNYKIKTKTK